RLTRDVGRRRTEQDLAALGARPTARGGVVAQVRGEAGPRAVEGIGPAPPCGYRSVPLVQSVTA
ncbi:MAG TPA: hypothetical protein VD834_14945, partial [Blastococcus sp.]|nr:hypothetical protein [Blastococcus sp.]